MVSPTQSMSLVEDLTEVIQLLRAIYDDIGLNAHEKDARESQVFGNLRAAITIEIDGIERERTEVEDECRHVIDQIRQLEQSLSGSQYHAEDFELKIDRPYRKCLLDLQEKLKRSKKRHGEQLNQVLELTRGIKNFAAPLESSFVQIDLLPDCNDGVEMEIEAANFDISVSYVERLEAEFERVYKEYNTRVATVHSLSQDIVDLYAALEIPEAQIDHNIVNLGASDPLRAGLSKEDIDDLKRKKGKLVNERERRQAKASALLADIEQLWEKLGVDHGDRRLFAARTKGYDLNCIHELEKELSRMLEIRKEHMHIFVDEARNRLSELWDKLYFSDDDIASFAPARSDVYTDSLLNAHEKEITRLQELYREREPLLQLVNRHKQIMEDKQQLEISANDATRLLTRGGGKRDPTRLLREEKMRKRVQKELPKIELELKSAIELFMEERGEYFMIDGENYYETIMAASAVCRTRRAKTPKAAPASASAPSRGRSNSTVTTVRVRSRSRPANERTQAKAATVPLTPSFARPKTPGTRTLVEPSTVRKLASTETPGSRIPPLNRNKTPSVTSLTRPKSAYGEAPSTFGRSQSFNKQARPALTPSKSFTVEKSTSNYPPWFRQQLAQQAEEKDRSEHATVRSVTSSLSNSSRDARSSHASETSEKKPMTKPYHLKMPPPPLHRPIREEPTPCESRGLALSRENLRQVSTGGASDSSTQSEFMSGSENWEAYGTDASESEVESLSKGVAGMMRGRAEETNSRSNVREEGDEGWE